jgi:hypothetical protein
MGESAAVGPGMRLVRGDVLLSINGIGTDHMNIDQVRLIVDSVGTDSVELVLSSGSLPTAATPMWIRQLGRAFRDHSLVDGSHEDGAGVAAPPPSAGGVALSLCGRDNLAEFDQHQVTFKGFAEGHSALLTNPALVVMVGGEAYTWEEAAPLLLAVAAYGRVPPSATALPLDDDGAAALVAAAEDPSTRSWWFFGSRSRTSSRRVSPPSHDDLSRSTSSVDVPPNPPADDTSASGPVDDETFAKSLILDSDGLKSLNLKPGENEALFCVTSKMQGKAIVQWYVVCTISWSWACPPVCVRDQCFVWVCALMYTVCQ